MSNGDSHIPALQHSSMDIRPDFSRGELSSVVRASPELRSSLKIRPMEKAVQQSHDEILHCTNKSD